MFIPTKITVRLDAENRRKLEKYLTIKFNRTASRVIRQALTKYLDEELERIALELAGVQVEERPLSDKFGLTKPKGSVQS